MQTSPYPYPKSRWALRSLAGLLALTASCAAPFAWSSSSTAGTTPKDSRNGGGVGVSSAATSSFASSRTPMEVSNGVARFVGHYPESSKLRVVIGLTPPKMAEEEKFLKALQDPKSPNFHKYLTAEQWNERFSPSAEDEQAVVDWAKSQGLTVTQRYPNRLVVDVEGTSSSLEKAFSISINNYLVRGATEFSNDHDPVIPANLGNVIQSIGGLNSLQRAHALHEGNSTQLFKSYSEGDVVSTGTKGQHDGNYDSFKEALKASDAKLSAAKTLKAAASNGPVDPNVTSGLIDPTDIYSSYGYSYGALQNQGHCCNPTHASAGTPANTSIAVATAYAFQGSDIAGFQSRYSYLAYHYQPIYIDGTPSCCNDETTLDTEWSIATANSFGSYIDTSEVYVYEGVNNLLSTFTDVYQVILNRNETRVFTTSWGCQEFACTDSGTMDTDHAIFNSMIGQGWTLMAATGDQGSAAGCGNAEAIQYPSSDPDIVAVGGTTLSLYSDGTLYSETGWQGGTYSGACSSNNGGSTGGCSGKYAAPGYQFNSGSFCGSGARAVPDISLNAGAGQNTFYNGGWYGFGGTSIASPMVAGFFAQANAYLTSLGTSYTTIGQGGPHLWYFAQHPTYASHYPYYDMTSGCNNNDITAQYDLGSFCAVSGYDRVTGWGSFNALQLAWALNAYDLGDFVAPAVSFSGPFSGGNGSDHWYNTDQTVSWTITDAGSNGLASTGIAGYSAVWDSAFTDPNSEPNGGAPNSFYNGPDYKNLTSGSLHLSSAGQGCHYATVDSWDNSGYTSGNQYYFYVCYDTVSPVSSASLSGTLRSGSLYTSPVKVTISSSDSTSGVAGTFYSVDGGGYATYSSPVTISALGNHTVTYYSKDVAGNNSTVKSVSFTISDVTLTTLTASKTSSTYGQSVTFTANVKISPSGTPTGSVQFLRNGVVQGTQTLSSGKATYTMAAVLAGGSNTITAHFVGSASYISSTSSAVTVNVSKASSTAVLASSLNPSIYHQTVVFTATVTPQYVGSPSGTVTFQRGGSTLGTVTLTNGHASYTTTLEPVATHTITAIYNGDGNFKADTSPGLSQRTNAAATSTVLTTSDTTPVYGQSVTLTAAITPAYGGSPTGTVNFYHAGTLLGSGTIAGGVAKLTLTTLPFGTIHVTATYAGDGNYLTSTSAAITETVSKSATTTTIFSSKNPSTHGTSVNFTAHVVAASGPTPTGTVTFKDGAVTLGTGTLNGSGNAAFATTSLSTGTHSITAVYGGNTGDAGSTSSALSQKVN